MSFAALLTPVSAGAQALAGREIVNVATATYNVDGQAGTADSNAARDRVNEVLAVAAAPLSPDPTPAADGERDRAVAFRLTNQGNGREAFALSLSMQAGDGPPAPSCTRLAYDSDGDGAFSASDALYGDGAEPALDAGASILVFAICDIPETVSEGQLAAISLQAVALTGTGAPGTVLSGRGETGVDAVVGAEAGAASARTTVVVNLGHPELIKAQSVRDPKGGTRVIPGAVVTYTLTARLTGRGMARDVSILDPVPTGSDYVPGSLSLDGQSLSDAEDADAGRFTGKAVEIVLGQLEQSRDRSVSFQVRVQ